MKKYALPLLLLPLLFVIFGSSRAKSETRLLKTEPRLQKKFDADTVKMPEQKFNRSKLNTYSEIYSYLKSTFGKPIKSENTQTGDGIFLKADYFKDKISGNQYFVASNTIPDYSQSQFVYYGIIAYSQKALDIGLKTTDYYYQKKKILLSSRYDPYIMGDVAISYREIPVTKKQKAYGISIFNTKEYKTFQEAVLSKTE
ncbi:hypothetical protein ACVR0O_00295 [Streptococcus caviae]|uniref:hypothetical protein n=1 Tax=Streptococcus sp. 'caviae' TaxID=1915004 RepID=UPI00094BA14C|nr:hypothetical protein [Streptococcus sp. 'caviae']OLN84816.1 hypothetical protein BMI76_01690 [Streptococcus sp. 'caviae']